MFDFKDIDARIAALAATQKTTHKPKKGEALRVGVDLGTAYIVVVVLGKGGRPLAMEMEYAEVVRDGLVVDFVGAREIVARMKARLEDRLGVSLTKAAIAVPPGTSEGDTRTHRYVAEGAGFEVEAVLDEPTAANGVLNIRDGAIVDIGGGTTGIAILKDGQVVYVADEPTGGTHLSLVLSGRYRIPFLEAEKMKKDRARQGEVMMAVRPVAEKMATIVAHHIQNHEVQAVFLVGGTCCLEGVEKVFREVLDKPVEKPANPFLVTPLGIALGILPVGE